MFLGCCPGSDLVDGFGKSGGDNGEKGLKVIVLSMFVFAVAVTVALFIQIAAGTCLVQAAIGATPLSPLYPLEKDHLVANSSFLL